MVSHVVRADRLVDGIEEARLAPVVTHLDAIAGIIDAEAGGPVGEGFRHEAAPRHGAPDCQQGEFLRGPVEPGAVVEVGGDVGDGETRGTLVRHVGVIRR